MLGWEWMTHKAELFGLPIRWATYDPSAPQTQIDQIADMLRNMGSAAWGAFPTGTDLQIQSGNTPTSASRPSLRPSLPSVQNSTSPCVHAASESTEQLQQRQTQAAQDFAQLLAKTDLSTHDLIWSGGDCPTCAPFNVKAYGNGWTTPPPLHHNCDCSIEIHLIQRDK